MAVPRRIHPTLVNPHPSLVPVWWNCCDGMPASPHTILLSCQVLCSLICHALADYLLFLCFFALVASVASLPSGLKSSPELKHSQHMKTARFTFACSCVQS